MLRLLLLLLLLLFVSFGFVSSAAAEPDDDDDRGAVPPILALGSATDATGQTITYAVREAPLLEFPGPVDSNSPALWLEGQLVVFNSAEFPTRSSGPSLDALGEPEAVTWRSPHRSGNWWLEAIWPDSSSGQLYGWYHLEPDDLPCLTAPVIGTAVSWDNGLTWTDLGPVLESGYPADCGYDNGYFVGGHGDFHVIVD